MIYPEHIGLSSVVLLVYEFSIVINFPLFRKYATSQCSCTKFLCLYVQFTWPLALDTSNILVTLDLSHFTHKSTLYVHLIYKKCTLLLQETMTPQQIEDSDELVLTPCIVVTGKISVLF